MNKKWYKVTAGVACLVTTNEKTGEEVGSQAFKISEIQAFKDRSDAQSKLYQEGLDCLKD